MPYSIFNGEQGVHEFTIEHGTFPPEENNAHINIDEINKELEGILTNEESLSFEHADKNPFDPTLQYFLEQQQ